MRNELNDIEKIERYLRNEMSGEEKGAFEKEMQTNPDLKKSMEEQRQLMKGMERMKIKSDMSKAKFKFQLKKGLINIGIPVLITAAITALVLNWSAPKKDKIVALSDSEVPQTSYTLPALNENGDSLWADADKYIPYQIFSIDNSKDTVIEGNDGTILAIPSNAFVDENGNTVKGNIDFELKEALNTETILKGGLTTTSNGELLETGGMFYLNARQDGKSLKLAEGKNIIADVPGDNTKTGMMLFDGERKEDGTINWVNPKPIEKPLVPVDIHTLNFYPPQYEDSLSAMTEKASIKKYKDSLYYSFAGRFGMEKWKSVNLNEVENDTIGRKAPVFVAVNISNLNTPEDKQENLGEILFNNLCTSCHKPNYNYTGPALKGARQRWKNAGYKDKIYEFVQNPAKILLDEKNNYAVNMWQKWKNSGIMNPQNLSRKEMDAIFDYVENVASDDFNVEDSVKTFSGLNPAKVKAIWNDKFQNTLIATKEFEERMPFIHRLCSRGNNVLDIYVKNIDKRISTIDSMVAKTFSGSDKETFLKFAARGEGRVKTDSKLLQKLGRYYDRQTEIYMKAARKTRDEYYEKNAQKDRIANKKSNNHSKKDFEREVKNFNKELMINLKDAYRQIGKKLVTVNGRVRLSTGLGWKNLDRYVLEATATRTTMNYTDPDTGKKAVLEYKPLTVKISNAENYDRILVYLIPNKLNSFMRMSRRDADGKKENGVFTEKLNMLFKHELIILAYKGDDSYFKYYKEVEPGEMNEIVLDKMDESKIKTRLYSMNRISQSEEVKKDISYQFFLQADQKRRKLFLEKEKLIQRIEKVIFPCGIDSWKSINYSEVDMAVPAQ